MPQHTDRDKQYYLEEELLLVQNSGEIPEVAFHSALFFLSEDPEGPRLALSEQDLIPLKRAVFERYRRILLRDLNPGLRHKRIYRGLLRCIANWQRFYNFCRRAQFDPESTRQELKKALYHLLCQEVEDVRSEGKKPSINCSAEALSAFMTELDLAPEILPADWQHSCFPAP